MSDDRNKLATVKQRLGDYRRGNAPRAPQPDPYAPHNPYHLPDANMAPSRMPTAADAARSGAGFLQAEMTCMLPMAIFHNIPGRLMNDFYDLTWSMKSGHADVPGFVEKFRDGEIAFILEALDPFPLDQLTAGGALFYEAFVEEMERRKGPAKRVRIAATTIEDTERSEQHDQHEEHHELQEAARTALPARTFPGPLLKPRT
jgi:hypothetical protein